MQEIWDRHRAEARCPKPQTGALSVKLREILSYASAKGPDDIRCFFPTLALGKLPKQQQKTESGFPEDPLGGSATVLDSERGAE